MLRIVLVISIMALGACSGLKQNSSAMLSESESLLRLRTNMEFLASDHMQGRETTSLTNYIAGDFIANKLQQYGIKPFGDDGTYFQNFDLEVKKWDLNSKISLLKDGLAEEYKAAEHFFPYGDPAEIENNEIIFLKFGITDSTYEYDDYAGLDVNGKTVVVISGKPEKEGDSLYFNTSKWDRSRGKSRLAKKHGAAGFIYVSKPDDLRMFARYSRWFMRESFDLPKDEKEEQGMVTAFIDSVLAKKIFDSQKNYIDLYNYLVSGEINTGQPLSYSIKWELKDEIKTRNARNVVGILNGTNPKLKDEIVTIGGHYDHVGISSSGEVYNGADDNASGTVAVLEAARRLALQRKNERPVLFIFHDAEEKGLLGAKYMTRNDPHVKNMIVHINMDMVGRESEDTLFVIGSGKLSSELYKIVEDANKETVNFVYDYTLDDEGHEILEGIIKSQKRMTSLIEDLLQLSSSLVSQVGTKT